MAKIGVDIGHGSNTFPPSKGVYKNGKGYHEHDANSRVATVLIRKLLAAGHSVYKAQNAGQNDVPLTTRTDRYFRNNVDLIVSCHANYNSNPSANGYASFFWSNDKEAKKLSDLYADEIAKQGFRLWGGSRPSVLGTWSEFHMCREPAKKGVPSILLENGFMGNSNDFKWIFGSKKEEYAEKCATAAFNAIQRYLGLPIEEKAEPKPTPKPKPKPKPKEEDEMLEKAIVINSFADFPVAESVAKNLKVPIYMRSTAEKQEVAKEVIVIGGSKNGLKGKKFTVLSGGDRFETAAKVAKYLK